MVYSVHLPLCRQPRFATIWLGKGCKNGGASGSGAADGMRRRDRGGDCGDGGCDMCDCADPCALQRSGSSGGSAFGNWVAGRARGPLAFEECFVVESEERASRGEAGDPLCRMDEAPAASARASETLIYLIPPKILLLNLLKRSILSCGS